MLRSCHNEGSAITSSKGVDCEALHDDGSSAVLSIGQLGLPGLEMGVVTTILCRISHLLDCPQVPYVRHMQNFDDRDICKFPG